MEGERVDGLGEAVLGLRQVHLLASVKVLHLDLLQDLLQLEINQKELAPSNFDSTFSRILTNKRTHFESCTGTSRIQVTD